MDKWKAIFWLGMTTVFFSAVIGESYLDRQYDIAKLEIEKGIR